MVGEGEVPLSFAIIGCGLIGRKRIKSLPPGQLAVACDLDIGRAEVIIAASGSGRASTDFADALNDSAVDVVIVSTLNSSLAPITRQAISAGKHVFVEKPAGISVEEIEGLMTLAGEKEVCVRVGYNHRFHPAIQKARELVDTGVLGPLMFIRARYGHGGRVGYNREWRADPTLSGGGELIDQGVHLIDLAGWAAPDRSRALVPRGLRQYRGRGRHVLLGHAGRRQCVHDAAHRGPQDGVSPRQLHGMEEHVLVRDLWADRED